MKLVLSLLTLCLSISARAERPLDATHQLAHVQSVIRHLGQTWVAHASQTGQLSYRVGDTTTHKLMYLGLPGKLTITVREEVDEGFWLEESAAMTGLTETVETLVDKEDGHTIRVIVNGQEVEGRGSLDADSDIVAIEQEKVQVPQREEPYPAIKLVLRNRSTGLQTEIWLNPNEVPINGLLKLVAQLPEGETSVELESFARGQ